MSTDHSRRVTADLDQAWLGGMSLFKTNRMAGPGYSRDDDG